MNPASFRIDFEVLVEVLIAITVLAFFVERALSLVFEHRLYVASLSDKGLKEPLAFVLSFAIVRYWKLDVLGMLFRADRASVWGYLITAAIIAGGSKASLKLFHDLLKVKSTAEKERLAAKGKAKS